MNAEPPVCCGQPMFSVLNDENVHQYFQCSDCEKTSEPAAPQPVSGPKNVDEAFAGMATDEAYQKETRKLAGETWAGEALKMEAAQPTPELLYLLQAADDVLAEQSLLNQKFTDKQDDLFTALMPWRDVNGRFGPYFPPASQTPHVEKVLDVIGGLIATYETGDHAENPCGDCVICTAEKILEQLATPASTAPHEHSWILVSACSVCKTLHPEERPASTARTQL